MAGLVDFIFENIKIEGLDRSGVLSYTKYISEIYQQNLTIDQKVRYQRVKVRLHDRLMELDKERFRRANKLSGKPSAFD